MNAMCGIDHHFAPSRMGSVWPVGDLALGGFAPSGLECIWSVTPRVAPWAVSLRPVGALNRVNPSFPAPKGRPEIAQDNALGMAPQNEQALKGRNIVSNGGGWVCALPGSAPSGHGFACSFGGLTWSGVASRPGSVWPIGDLALGGFAPSGLECIWTVGPRVAPWAVSLRPVGASNRVNPSFPAPTGRYVIAQGNALGMAPQNVQALKGRKLGWQKTRSKHWSIQNP